MVQNGLIWMEQHYRKYMELVEANMDKELTKIRDNNG